MQPRTSALQERGNFLKGHTVGYDLDHSTIPILPI